MSPEKVADGVKDWPMTTCERVLVVLVVPMRGESTVLVKPAFNKLVPPEEPATVTVGTEKALHVCLYAVRIIECPGFNLYSPNRKANTHYRPAGLRRQ